jgi:4-amino-4-deoxy-L-arabinose transferase-like glycosyltransferase
MSQSRWWGSPRFVAALGAIVAAAAAIRIDLFAGFVGLDDAEYARFAYQIAHGTFHLGGYTGPAVFPLRIGVIAPTALAFHLAGLNEAAMVAYPFALSLAGIALIYLLACIWFGPRAGLLAAALLAVFPWDIDGATKLVPDLPAAFYAAAAVTTIAWLLGKASLPRSRLVLGGVAGGLMIGASWLCKESIAYLAPFFLAWLALSLKRRGRHTLFLWGGVAAGSLAVLVTEMVLYHHATGDFLFRFHEVDRNYHQWENSFFTEGSAFGWAKGTSYSRALLHRLFVSGPAMILLNRSMLYVPTIGLAVAVYGWLRRDQSFLLPGIWLGTLVLMFNFSSSSTTTYMPLALFNRYLSPIFFPAIILVAGFLDRTISARGPARSIRWAGLATAGLLTWVGGISLLRSLRNRSTWLSEIPALETYVRPQTVTYADALTLRALEFSEGYPQHTAWLDLGAVASADQVPRGSLVVINPTHIQWLDKNAGMWVSWPAAGPTDPTGYARRFFYRPQPQTWTPIWHGGDVALYRVGASTPAGPPRRGGSHD